MQKKIIVLAIAAALTAPALAFAEATVFGQANLAINIVNDGNTNSGTSHELSSYGSRLGFKGSEDLGTGMSVVWQMEGSVDVDTGASFLFDRNTYLGLSSAGMGTILGGHYDSPYKISTRRLDVFGDTAADNRANNGGLMGMGHDVGRANSLVYLSPSWGGFSLAAATVFGAEGAAANQTKGTALSLAGMYEAGPLYATLAYDSLKYGNVGDLNAATAGRAVNDEDKAWKAGVGYAMDAITVNAVIEKPKFTAAAGGSSSSTNLYLGGKFAISTTDAIKLAYSKRGTVGNGPNDAKQYAIGYDHNMSSNTTVYALYTKKTDNTAGAPDPSIISVGMKHMF